MLADIHECFQASEAVSSMQYKEPGEASKELLGPGTGTVPRIRIVQGVWILQARVILMCVLNAQIDVEVYMHYVILIRISHPSLAEPLGRKALLMIKSASRLQHLGIWRGTSRARKLQ
jgi:hypothetical protein